MFQANFYHGRLQFCSKVNWKGYHIMKIMKTICDIKTLSFATIFPPNPNVGNWIVEIMRYESHGWYFI